MKSSLTLLLACAAVTTTLSASSGPQVDVRAHTRRAERVVVATVADIQPRFDVNEHGDRLIISQVWLTVEDTLKGTSTPMMAVDIEGGTIGELKLEVSDMPRLERGQRGVFFLNSTKNGAHRPQGRGQGILKLDGAGRVAGTQVSLAEVKASVRTALQQ